MNNPEGGLGGKIVGSTCDVRLVERALWERWLIAKALRGLGVPGTPCATPAGLAMLDLAQATYDLVRTTERSPGGERPHLCVRKAGPRQNAIEKVIL